MEHEYFVFHVLNLCPPDDIMVNALRYYQHSLDANNGCYIPNKSPIVNLYNAISLIPQFMPFKVKGPA